MTAITLMDGGLASELEKLGHQFNDDPLWSSKLLVTSPKCIQKVHKSYLDAGAQIITTASYQASVEGFVTHLKLAPDQALERIADSVKLVREAMEDSSSDSKEVRVAGSIGPYGVFLHDGSEYHGNYIETMSAEELMSWQQPKVEALLKGGCDLLAFETIPSQGEAVALIRLLKKFPSAKAWLSFSAKDATHISHGETLSSAMEACIRELGPGNDQLVAIGVNCTAPELVEPLLRCAHSAFPELPLMAYPNSGETWDPKIGWVAKVGIKPIASLARNWLDQGLHYIGGCCRTGPADIRALGRILHEWQSKKSK